MKSIYEKALSKVIHGAKFSISFENRSLKVNGKYLIENGEYEGMLGYERHTSPIERIEKLYSIYRHSVPSERSESKRRRYFRALSEDELSDDDMFYGSHREIAQFELEMFVLSQLLLDNLRWEDFADGLWFWQSPSCPTLILLKKWIIKKVNH